MNNKKKNIIITTIVIILILWSGWCYYYYTTLNNNFDTTKIGSDWEKNTWDTSQDQTLSKEEKLAQLKRRMNFKSIIRKWDFYSIKNMKETALQYYINAYKRLKNDHIIEKKIWDTYFEMKEFNKAYQFYSKIPSWEADEKLKDKIFKSLLYTGNKNMRDEYNKIKAPEKLKEYYDKILVCYTWIKNCLIEIKSYTWSNDKINTIKSNILNFEKIEHSDSNSKYAILAWDFMKNKDFLASALIWQETLTKRPNYTSVLKLVWFARYELWDYKKSNEYLQKYYQIEPKDFTVTYVLGIINFYLENYISSNLYFNAAVLNWYTPKTELQKRLAYNYYIIGDKKNMLKVFRYILDEADTTQEDYSVALYTAIEEKEYWKAMLWANKWIKRFPESDMIYAFRWWLYSLRWEEAKALNDLNLAVRMNKRNAVALYNLWLISYKKWYYDEAMKYFNNTVEADKNWTFWDKAEQNIIDIKKEQEKLINSWSQINSTHN